MICEDCMQLINSNKCLCNTGIVSTKYISLVKGCTRVNKNGKRCKGIVKKGFCCQKHNIPISPSIEKIFDKIKIK